MSPARWLAAIRFDEVLVLQGAPLLGLAFGAARGGLPGAAALLAFLAASSCLVAHVFVLNDWSEMEEGRPAASGLDRRGTAMLAIALLAGSLGLFALVEVRALLLAAGIAALSALYSAPPVRGKGIPVVSSALHLGGGLLHFLLGYAAAAVPDLRAVAVGSALALTFTAGHLTQEVRDHAHDLRLGTRTNAVAFGKARAFAAGFVLFTLAFGLLFALAWNGLVPRAAAPAVALLYPLHAYGAFRALRSGLAPDRVRGFQWRYRALFALLGAAILAALAIS